MGEETEETAQVETKTKAKKSEPIDTLNLTTTIYNKLQKENITTVDELREKFESGEMESLLTTKQLEAVEKALNN